jgi:nitroreductase
MNAFACQANAIIAVIAEKCLPAASIAGAARGTKFNLIDVGMACQNFVLAAAGQGLGTCVLGWFDEAAVKKILNIPRSKKVCLLISLGYPEYPQAREKTRKSLDQIRSYNQYK